MHTYGAQLLAQCSLLNGSVRLTTLDIDHFDFYYDDEIFNMFVRYRTFRLIDIGRLYELMPLTLEEFTNEMMRCTDEKAQYLLENWITECADTAEEFQNEIEYIVDKQAEQVQILYSIDINL